MIRHVFTVQNAENEDIWTLFNVLGGQIVFVTKEDMSSKRRTYGKPKCNGHYGRHRYFVYCSYTSATQYSNVTANQESERERVPKYKSPVPDLSGGVPWGPSLVGTPSAGPPGFGKERGHNRGLGVKPPAAGDQRVWGWSPQPLTNFYDFHIKH